MTESSPEALLASAGWTLPPAPRPRGAYAPFCATSTDGLQFVAVSGQTCRIDGVALAGVCRTDEDLEPARHAARIAMLNALAALRVACNDDLRKVEGVLRLRGFVRSTPDFTAHGRVLDAASEVLHLAFAPQVPARSAIGASSLPDGAWIEIELDALVRI